MLLLFFLLLLSGTPLVFEELLPRLPVQPWVLLVAQLVLQPRGLLQPLMHQLVRLLLQ